MIRIQRGREPQKLAGIRQEELRRIRAARRATTGAPLDFGKRYNQVRRELWSRQHYKCCYCEVIEQLQRNDVEHFRPKARARRGAGFPDETGYWWLTWTWKNLLFACAPCNQDHKGTRFPLEPGNPVLKPERSPPGGERALLIDPAIEDPMRHLRFEPYTLNGVEHWRPNPRGGSSRGLETIATLGLDRPGLLDLYRDHVRDCVRPKVERFRRTVATGDRAQIRQDWEELTRELLAPARPFTALSHDALDQLVPEAERRRWKLKLDRPGA